jgi:glutathione S-transferase
MIYHVVTLEEWAAFSNNDLPYAAPSLVTEGFIHCSYQVQVEGVVSRYYQQIPHLYCLEIDTQLLDATLLRVELAPNGEYFPHYYAAIPRAAIAAIQTLR